ncbi:TIGR03087 family PEP-CTERM/XrtA system glycosyltransferase [Marinobacter manganoxydans]|uniref:Sugar transferase, PEP-CTERM/EpsH1 system associated protein n=1 Tax=Marinobacter manganoxydans MnI7-9 TaxID=1094979 RepID=G6YRM0_9GAMM|nr:TIGR03087 family PEP-CTERM/XrtA system glycosyltransferase [Marinobacter manganoxydans]EHJ05151.1 sugar transferase, PEP-CTERM/EpsH1 system associated protein [Marinobacter manganoxydans MnI7-9]
MKIVVLSHRIPFPANKGEKIRTFHQIQYLADCGHEITVLAPYEHAEEISYGKALEERLKIKTIMFPLRPKWLRLARGLVTNDALTLSYFYSAGLQKTFDRLVSSGDYDTVLCTGSAMAPYVFRNPELTGRDKPVPLRLIMDFMDLDSDKWRQYQASSGLPMKLVYGREARLINRVELRSYQRFDECFFISANEVDLFSMQLPENRKLSVLGNGINTSSFFPVREEDAARKPTFLFTGVMNYKPNEDAVLWFVDVLWERIRAEWPDAEFIIAGMDPSSRIKQLGKLPGITVTGLVEDIVPFYQKADIFVAPFRIARGVQNKILQALACGLPVITTRLGLEGINATPGEDILVADTEQEFFEAIKKILETETLYNSLSLNGAELIQREYSWDSVLQGLARAIEVKDCA